ncbi:MAG: hypothetical protein ACE361_05925 [Aureliella sp.]
MKSICKLTLCLGLMFTLLSDVAMAAKYRELKVAEPSSAQRKLARDFIKGAPASDEARKALAAVIDSRVAKLTQESEMANYERIRTGIFNEYLASFKPEADEARKIVVAEIVKYAGGIAGSNQFSPQARINAVSLLAILDDYPIVKGVPPRPAVAAQRPLILIAKNEKSPLYLRSIALYGIERHIGRYFLDWKPQFRGQLGQMLIGIVNSKPASNLDVPAHAWMVRRAFDCLGTTGSTVVADRAIELMGDPDTLPSVRLSACDYMSMVNSSKLTDEQKQSYLISLSHLLRSQLVAWYEHEDDLLSRASGGAAGGGMYGGGGYGGGGYGGGGMGPGGMGPGGGMGGMGPGGGYGGDGMYGGGAGAGSSSEVKAIDVQDWQTILARRKANQLAQTVHLCLNSLPTSEARKPKKVGVGLIDAKLPSDLNERVEELIEKLDAFQVAINDVGKSSDVNELLNEAEIPIEDIMDLVLTIPGFGAAYPELAQDQELETVPDKVEQPAEGGGASDKAGPEGGEEGPGDPAAPDSSGVDQ